MSRYRFLTVKEVADILYRSDFNKVVNFTFDGKADITDEPTEWYGVKRTRLFDEQYGILTMGCYGGGSTSVEELKNDSKACLENTLMRILQGEARKNITELCVDDACIPHPLRIGGFQKTTLLDYPGKVAATVFVTGCNFRCPYCHNAKLINPKDVETIPEKDVLSFLEQRKNILEGVCITGGEPTLQEKSLKSFITALKEIGYSVKLDTNGTNPDFLESLIEERLVDYVAMDVKSGLVRYKKATGGVWFHGVEASASILREGNVPYEFRTTVVKGIHVKDDFEEIRYLVHDCTDYYIQNYKPSENILNPQNLSPFSEKELQEFADIMKPYVQNVHLRGV